MLDGMVYWVCWWCGVDHVSRGVWRGATDSASVCTQRALNDGRNKVRSLPRRRAFYFIACIHLSIPSSGIYLPSLSLTSVHFRTDCGFGRHPSDGANTCYPVSIAPTSQPSLSHLVSPNDLRILLRVHRPLKRRTSRHRLRQTRQASPPLPSPLRRAILTLTLHLQANNNKDVVWELLFSLPTTRLTSIITASINTLLILLAADFVFSPVIDSANDVTFTRLGAVYPDAAKITVRYPFSGSTNATENNVIILWRPTTAAAAEPWTDGPTLHLQPDFDWTNTTKLTKLWPSTEYECAYTNPPIICRKALYFTTVCSDVLAHTNRTLLPYPASPIRFRTFPDSRLQTGSHFRFVVTSCLTPNFPYVPLQSKRIRGFDLLADYLFPESTVVDTPSTVAYVKANDNVTENPIPLESDIGIETNESVPEVVPAALEVKHGGVAPTEFMLFLVRGGYFLWHGGTLTYHRVTLSTPTSQFTTAIPSRRIVACTDATTTVLASVKSLSDFVRLLIFVYAMSDA